MPLFKAFKAPKAAISINIGKGNFALGETITGDILVTSEEEFEGNEIRVELDGVEKVKFGGQAIEVPETPETRVYGSASSRQIGDTVRYEMYRGQTKVSEKLKITKGYSQQFPFKITIPVNLGPTFRGMRRGGWLERTWTLKGVLAAGGRPDVEAKRDIQVSMVSALSAPIPVAPGVAKVEPTVATKPTPTRMIITNCTRCSAPISPSQEDLIVTCRYCGSTISLATQEEIKKHSMLENLMFTQQAVAATQNFMDKGILRAGVSRDAQITNVKLRYVPFWFFPVDATTSLTGVAGSGIMGEIHQVEEALKDERASKLSKFGKIVKAGVSAAEESRQKERRPVTVSQTFSSFYVWPTLARKTMISEINYYDVPTTKKIPFDVGKIPSDAEFLNTELNEEEAKTKVKSEVESRERLIASGKVDTLQTCYTTVTTGEVELVHAPIWFVHYTLKGENYVIAIDGCEGKVLGGGRPLLKFP
jgi:DNA-directed RNA polymerase subunit RPC12/RpoP